MRSNPALRNITAFAPTSPIAGGPKKADAIIASGGWYNRKIKETSK
jgi:hypothetical protein